MNAGPIAVAGASRCHYDNRACPFGGCSLSLCARHEFVPVASLPRPAHVGLAARPGKPRGRTGMDNAAQLLRAQPGTRPTAGNVRGRQS